MTWHIIEGEDGCTFAKEHDCVAVVVDALRASATAAMFLHHGVEKIIMIKDVVDAKRAANLRPGATLAGERAGLPPHGFDLGNSPLDADKATGNRVVFTTTTGTTRLVDAIGARAVMMGTTINALATIGVANNYESDVVLIPAGKAGDPGYDADEDWAAATFVASLADANVGEGALLYRDWQQRLEWDGIQAVFESSLHGKALISLGMKHDVDFCAKTNVTDAVPLANGPTEHGILVVNAPR